MLDYVNLAGMKCWPLNGWAPGGYLMKSCPGCKKDFTGDKRSSQCLECAINGLKLNIEKLSNTISGMGKEIRKADQKIANPDEHVAAAAVYHGSTISLPRPARHGDILATMSVVMGIDAMRVPPENQGFVTSTGRFVGRVEAKGIAWRAKQIVRHSAGEHCPELFSEDLW